MSEFSDTIKNITKTVLWRRAAQEQGGLLSGQDPSAFNTADPLRLWIIQVGVIVLTTQLLSLGLRKMRQPKVIAEVIGGILLGPTAFGRIPGFTEHIFPQDSRPYLSLVANIGLCLFLFLVGLEIDSGVIKRNARLSFTVALAGMVIPFGLGAALSVPLYNKFIDESVKFTHFMLFTGVAYSITAFPVLCRILTELKLLDTTVGIVVLSAGVGNDIVGWTLLALSVALVNAGSGLMALWILLTCVGWTLLLLFPVKIILSWLARRTGSIENGPTIFFMTVTILVLFGSAFMTDVIGVHAIFGAFLAGIIVPRQGGLAIALTEKLEDMVSIIFLPLYFTLSGLSTDLGLLNNGITWGFTIAICALAYFGKFGGCTIAARFAGFTWRESSTIGSLMSCKGLVELIVLNVGLSAGILSQRVFSMFVLEALLLTFMTTPAVVMLYPPEMRVRVAAKGSNFSNVPDGQRSPHEEEGKHRPQSSTVVPDQSQKKERLLVVLDRIEHLPGIMALTQLVQPPPPYTEYSSAHPNRTTSSSSSSSGDKQDHHRHIHLPHLHSHHSEGQADHNETSSVPFTPYQDDQLSISALRLIEITDRTSAVMKYSSMSTENLRHTDPLLSIFRTFVELGSGEGGSVELNSEVKMASYDDLPGCVKDEARIKSSQMVVIPWLPSIPGLYSTQQHDDGEGQHHNSGLQQDALPNRSPISTNPFEALFRTAGSDAGVTSGSSGVGPSTSALHSQFVRSIFGSCGNETDVALYVDQESASSPTMHMKTGGRYHLFVPFFGGPDDRLALEFAVQMCSQNPRISASIVRVVKVESSDDEEELRQSIEKPEIAHLDGGDQHVRENMLTIQSTTHGAFPDTVYGNANTQTRLQSETADNILWARYTSHNSEPLQRITFKDLPTSTPLHSTIQQIRTLLPHSHATASGSGDTSTARLLVVCGRSRRLAVESHHQELKTILEEYKSSTYGVLVSKTAGDVAASVILSGTRANLVVMQASLDSTST
ncbi:Sodium/hydrogen exchanger family-domain-containing protein [Abortiporus biennis]|nr:Sodium/hydrogen exchanger family-domain-containing protein [Abortiporus biennis]